MMVQSSLKLPMVFREFWMLSLYSLFGSLLPRNYFIMKSLPVSLQILL